MFSDEGEAVKFMMKNGLIDASVCPNCGAPVRCWKKKWGCDTTTLDKANLLLKCHNNHVFSPFKNTFFGGMKIPKNKILFVLYLWSAGINYIQAEMLSGCTNRVVGQLYKFMNEACEAYVLSECSRMQVGGQDIIVEIDESKLFTSSLCVYIYIYVHVYLCSFLCSNSLFTSFFFR